jgi:acyl carrier protein
MTATGKVDRKALPIPGGERPDLSTPYYPPCTELEEKLVEIWQDVLELDEIGVNDSFLDLGGNSLLAARIIARVIDTMQVEIPLRLLFESPTIAQMAIAIFQSQIPDQDFDRLLSELESMSDQEVQRELSRSEVEEIVGRIPDWQME